MASKVSCFFLFTIIAVTNAAVDYYKQRGEGLIAKLSGLKKKHGLNFAHIEGVASLPQTYKKYHPTYHISHSPANPDVVFDAEKLNIIAEKTKPKQIARTRDEDTDETNEIMRSESLRMCKQEPKKYPDCKRSCSPYQKPRFPKLERSGDDQDNDDDDDTVNLMEDLEQLLAGNGIYRMFLGCVGNMCGGSHRGSHDKDRDNADGREYLGCFGDGCSTNRDDDDTGVRR